MSTLLLEVNGVEYEDFTSASVTCQLDALAGSFSFEAVSTKKQPLPIRQGDACKITVDGNRILTGFIEQVDVDYDVTSHSIRLAGRSKTADIIDSTIFSLEIKAPISLKAVIKKVIEHIGAPISVFDNVGNLKDFNAAEDSLSPEIGQNAFEFIEELARKRQVLLTTNGFGNIVITNSGTDISPINLQNIIGNDNNNIESASVSYDDVARFSKYKVESQLNPVTANVAGQTSTDALVNQPSDDIIDEKIRTSRQLLIQAESSSSVDQATLRCKWEANLRKTRSIVYSVTLPQFSYSGKLWRVNQLASIIDEFAGINSTMLVTMITYVLDSSGSNAIIAFVEKDAYTTLLNEPTEGNTVGDGLVT